MRQPLSASRPKPQVRRRAARKIALSVHLEPRILDKALQVCAATQHDISEMFSVALELFVQHWSATNGFVRVRSFNTPKLGKRRVPLRPAAGVRTAVTAAGHQ